MVVFPSQGHMEFLLNSTMSLLFDLKANKLCIEQQTQNNDKKVLLVW